jgi:IclR family transcriptional regulator, acetate operon repressor
MRNSGPDVTSVDNALKLLRLVAEGQGLRVVDAAQALHIAPSTAHRLLGVLLRHGFVAQERNRGPYRAGPALAEIALGSIAPVDLRRISRPLLSQLRDLAQETVNLIILQGQNILFIESIEGPRSVRVGSRLGMVFPARLTAGGKVLLAGLPADDVIRRFSLGPNPLAPAEWQRLSAELDRVRHIGHATNFEEREIGVSAVAVAINDVRGAPLAALAISAPADRLRRQQHVEALLPPLKATAGVIESRLRIDQPALISGDDNTVQADTSPMVRAYASQPQDQQE